MFTRFSKSVGLILLLCLRFKHRSFVKCPRNRIALPFCLWVGEVHFAPQVGGKHDLAGNIIH